MHEGAVSRAARHRRHPLRSPSRRWSRATPRSRATSCGRVHIQHLSCAESVEAVAHAKATGGQRHRRGQPAPPDAHRRGRPRLDTSLKMNPPLRTESRPPGADRGASLGRHRLRRDGPRAARARREGGCRSSRRRWAPRAWRPRSPPSTPSSCCPGPAARAARRADDGGAPRCSSLRRRGSRSASRPTCAWSTSTRRGSSARPATRAARRTAASRAASCTAASC